MRIGISTDGVNITQSKIVPTPADFEPGIQTLKQTADELLTGEKIDGVSGGVAIILDKDKTMAIRSTHLKGWIHKPLKTQLESLFNAPVQIENDSHLAGLGEAARGAGQEKEIVAYITIGSGIGGVRIVDKKMDKNALGFEPGHQIIVPDGNDCACGGKGHLEAYTSGSYFPTIYHQKGEDIKDPAIWDEIAKYLAIGLTNTVVHWSPETIVLGGSVSESIPGEKVQSYLDQYLTVFPQAPQVVKATLGQDGGLYGALELLK